MSLRFLLALVFVFSILSGCNTVRAAAAQAPRADLPAELGMALTLEYGQYDDVINWDSLLSDLQTADAVCIGEAHYDARDMETAFEVVRGLAKQRKLALAVERFSYALQPDLDRLYTTDRSNLADAGINAIFSSKDYHTVWGATGSFDQSGYPVNTPSQPIFEAMVKWAAQAGIPLIGLDVTLQDRKNGLGENLPYRNTLWKNRVEQFLANHPREKYLVVVIGGINHMDNAPASFPSQMKNGMRKVVSLGQRDAMYQFRSSLQVQALAQENSMSDLVVRHPTQALTNAKSVPLFGAPPDYWIAVHTPEQIQ